MSRIDDAISSTAYILSCLTALRNIHETGSCNDCDKQKNCLIEPRPGQMVRYNCYMYRKREGEEKESFL